MRCLPIALIKNNYSFWLAGVTLLAAALGAVPVQAHVGLSEEIVEVTARIADDPDSGELYLLRGDMHRSSKHWPEALADFRKVLQLDPGSAAAELGLGRTWLDQGEYWKAIEHLDRALAREPGNVRALVSRARALGKSGDHLAAAGDYQRAIDAFKTPKDPLPDYYFEQAHALEAAGAGYLSSAIATLDAGIARLGSLRILEDLAIELERKRSNYAGALERLDRVIERSARKEALLMRRADIQLEAGRPAAAKADFAAARAAIDALPAQRRHSRAVKTLRNKIDRRMRALKHSGGGE